MKIGTVGLNVTAAGAAAGLVLLGAFFFRGATGLFMVLLGLIGVPAALLSWRVAEFRMLSSRARVAPLPSANVSALAREASEHVEEAVALQARWHLGDAVVEELVSDLRVAFGDTADVGHQAPFVMVRPKKKIEASGARTLKRAVADAEERAAASFAMAVADIMQQNLDEPVSLGPVRTIADVAKAADAARADLVAGYERQLERITEAIGSVPSVSQPGLEQLVAEARSRLAAGDGSGAANFLAQAEATLTETRQHAARELQRTNLRILERVKSHPLAGYAADLRDEADALVSTSDGASRDDDADLGLALAARFRDALTSSVSRDLRVASGHVEAFRSERLQGTFRPDDPPPIWAAANDAYTWLDATAHLQEDFAELRRKAEAASMVRQMSATIRRKLQRSPPVRPEDINVGAHGEDILRMFAAENSDVRFEDGGLWPREGN